MSSPPEFPGRLIVLAAAATDPVRRLGDGLATGGAVVLVPSLEALPAALAAGPCHVLAASLPERETVAWLGRLRATIGGRGLLLVAPDPSAAHLALARRDGPADWVAPERLAADGPARLRALAREAGGEARQQEQLAAIAGGLAHDLNGVLGSLMGAAAQLRTAAAKNPALAELAGRIDQAAARGAGVIARLSAAVALDAGGAATPDAGEPAAQLREAVATAREALPQDWTLRLADLPADLPPRLPPGLPQLVGHLVDAAASQLPKGGDLTLSLHPDGAHWRLDVAGVGAASSPSQRLSDANPMRGRAATTPAGLAWALAQRQTQALGGGLACDRDGATLRVQARWPAAHADPDAAAAARTPTAPASPHLSAAVMEASPLVRGILHDALALLHIGRIHDLDPDDALDQRQDLVGCTLYLLGCEPHTPALPGLIAALRAKGADTVVLLSAAPPPATLDVDRWVAKPVKLGDLQRALATTDSD